MCNRDVGKYVYPLFNVGHSLGYRFLFSLSWQIMLCFLMRVSSGSYFFTGFLIYITVK